MTSFQDSRSAEIGGEGPDSWDEVRIKVIGPSIWIVASVILVVYFSTIKPLDFLPILSKDQGAQATVVKNADQLMPGRPRIEKTLLVMLFENWLLVSAIAVVALMVSGLMGGGLGLPALFRNPHGVDVREEMARRKQSEYVHARGRLTAFLGAMGAMFLVAEVWSVIFYLEIVDNFETIDANYFTQKVDGPPNSFVSHEDLRWFLVRCCAPFFLILLLAGLFPSRAPGIERRGKDYWLGTAWFASGLAVASVIIVVSIWIGASFHAYSEKLWMNLFYPVIKGIPLLSHYQEMLKIEDYYPDLVNNGWRKHVDVDPKFIPDFIVVMASFTSFVGTVLIFYLSLASLRNRLSPGLGICMLLSFAIFGYALLAMLSTFGQVIFGLLALGWFVYANGDRYKYRFPGMDSYYAKGGLVDKTALDSLMKPDSPEEGREDDASGEEACAKLPRSLGNIDVLNSWKKATGHEKPKLVLVATTGGAYRAAFWTTTVLDELGRYIETGFHRHIRLITGASGGMVGAAYFIAKFEKDGPPKGGVTDQMRDETGMDSLTTVVRRLVLRDLPLSIWPFPQAMDRGIELEQEWESLDLTFPDLADGERDGWRPSMIVSPMVVESGRRLLISNLDLSVLAETRPLGQMPRPGATNPDSLAARLYSSSAVEFFRVFPKARETFSFRTAIRMSATFPLASPAVSLPTDPPRRVVDAGYYDNFGVDLSTSWAYEHQDWIRENTSGLALIQLRAYPSENDIQTYFGLVGGTSRSWVEKLIARVAASFQGLTSPLNGGLSAREGSMRFRNASQVRALDDIFNRDGRERFFETFVFENYADFAMNWFISKQDLSSMKHSIGAPQDEHLVKEVVEETDATSGLDADIRPDRTTIHKAQAMVKDKNLETKDKLKEWWNRA